MILQESAPSLGSPPPHQEGRPSSRLWSPPSPPPQLRVPLSPARPWDQWPLHTKARQPRFFKILMSAAALASVLRERGPPAQPGPSGAGPSSAEPGRRRVEILGPPAASVLPEKRVRFLHTGQGGHRTATPDLTLHDAPMPTRARGSTRTGRTNGRLHNTEPETKIHDRYHECLLSTPRTHC